MERDYLAEMQTVIDAETAKPGYVAPLLARDIVEKLRANDPELLAGWLDLQAVDILREVINRQDRSARARTAFGATRAAFRQVAEDAAAADTPDGARRVVADWLERRETLADGRHIPLGDMRGPDCRARAGYYADQERAYRMRRIFFETLAAKIGDDRVRDHFTSAQLETLVSGLPT